jgi:hypothetical protein
MKIIKIKFYDFTSGKKIYYNQNNKSLKEVLQIMRYIKKNTLNGVVCIFETPMTVA